jgi:dienelactone hydrolase
VTSHEQRRVNENEEAAMRSFLGVVILLVGTCLSSASERFDVARNWQGQQINLRPELFMPAKADKPVPVMVVLHGSAGLKPAHVELARWFTGMGVAGVALDSFGPRKIASTAQDQRALPEYAMLVDAVRTAQELANNPKVGASRIGLVGFSKGGTVAIMAALDRYTKQFKTGGPYRLLIALYPSCTDFPLDFTPNRMSLRLLLGERDTYTSVASCQDYAARLKAKDGDVAVNIYKDTKHGWFVPGATNHLNPNAQNFSQCHFDEIETGTWVERKSRIKTAEGGVFLPDSHKQAISHCVTKGAVSGYSKSTRDESLRDIRSYVQDAFMREASK